MGFGSFRTATLATIVCVCLALLGAGCRSTSVAVKSGQRIEPFNFSISSASDEFHIEGYLAHGAEPGRLPTLLVLNPGAGNARKCIKTACRYTQLGINVACISLPGYGGSSGPGRFSGPQSVAAARHALDLLAARPDVDGSRMGVWGLETGAVTAGLLMDADRRPRVVILQSGTYDMTQFWPEARLLTKLSILHQIWPSHRVLKERSVVDHLPPKLTCKVLILHGRKDKRVPLNQAEQLAAALRDRGAAVETHYYQGGGDKLGSRVDSAVAAFLRQNLLPG
jgi:dipeptidyl aminopeptidase/acylaminoacyl peptidase